MNTTVDNSARPIKTRRIKFRYPTGSLNRHYVQGDLVMSHIIAMLSAVFPEGEDYFIRSVKHYSDQITDPVLKKQVAGFIGQEVTHGREHRELNDRLQQMGYPTAFVDRMTKRGMNFYTLRFPPRFNLAVTAALEHYTATLAETLLTDQRAQDLLGDTEVRSILLWHALEESEHRAVAFDVYRTVGGTERMRIWAMRYITCTFICGGILESILSLSRDRAAYNPIRLFKSATALRHSPFVSREIVGRIRAYNRPGFHPDEFDNTDLLERWNAELFGEQGQLADHLR
ncbi:metal-dependent hydrolase [Mycobacteroides abscessus]|uniref:metal-dependent hydrolase n=5 Tax=Mycobacteroides abscessus TaxID=36809 RepID=UPI0009A8DBB7|nr:metal-dependent hydrolase [Mycobacteroides abscessus]SKH64117.1 metal-dependent hydrolase [Mycobacteroides abscessus subsp. massiliense]SKH72137.1 metal-dependent hydrolase [Mycobacteroides abscessus subsp. massiliense]SKI08995.1 metal-dependent hydrolase [Mycobacteroides abscessus subsp. massiliense]SKI61523.1 metal-dependent hydrolase [Mycobacteroides abscessus subsp. massiliense]SKJ93607.1 metal-dependent hydrolase [Mycobacteroides abscessus subsp. massiliense]